MTVKCKQLTAAFFSSRPTFN